MGRKQLSKSEIKKLLEEYSFLRGFIDKKSNVAQEDNFLVVDGEKLFFFKGDVLVPSLKVLLKNILLPQVVVDKGAVRFVVNGADIMRPEIVGCEEFNLGDYVVVVEETYKKPLSVCKALFSSEDLLNKKEGKVLQNVHFVGDFIWENIK